MKRQRLIAWWFDTNQEVVGEARYQETLHRIKRERRGEKSDPIAVLKREPTNPHDTNAVIVLLENEPIGYLPRAVAAAYQPLMADAERSGVEVIARAALKGGTPSKPSIGVWLDAKIDSDGHVFIESDDDADIITPDHILDSEPTKGIIVWVTPDGAVHIPGHCRAPLAKTVRSQREYALPSNAPRCPECFPDAAPRPAAVQASSSAPTEARRRRSYLSTLIAAVFGRRGG